MQKRSGGPPASPNSSVPMVRVRGRGASHSGLSPLCFPLPPFFPPQQKRLFGCASHPKGNLCSHIFDRKRCRMHQVARNTWSKGLYIHVGISFSSGKDSLVILIYGAGCILTAQDRDYPNVPMLVKYPDGLSTARYRLSPKV